MKAKFKCICNSEYDTLIEVIKCCSHNHGFGDSQLKTEDEVIASKLMAMPMIKYFCSNCGTTIIITSVKDVDNLTSCSNCSMPLGTTEEREEMKLLLNK